MSNLHFPRPELAEQIIASLKAGIFSSFALIAPRRKGKTAFILLDLAPVAIKKGYFPLYISLWQERNSPHLAICQALEDAIASLNRKSALQRLLGTKIRKASINNEFLGKVEMEFADNPESAQSHELLKIETLLNLLVDQLGKKQLLLLVDEVQHLATSTQFDNVTHALRTSLDKRQGAIKAVFTGSSRHYMNQLFAKPKSPFYLFGESIPFPDLGEEFLNHLIKRLAIDYDIDVNYSALEKIWRALDKSPFWMMKVINRLITADPNLKSASAYVFELLTQSEDYEALAKSLKPADVIVFLAIANNESPFGKDTFTKINKQTTIKGNTGNVQRSIKRLLEKSLISQAEKGIYRIESPGLTSVLKRK
ncbi:MAG: hypothetical protein V3T17_14295 [Pseudomonadales bacterium]